MTPAHSVKTNVRALRAWLQAFGYEHVGPLHDASQPPGAIIIEYDPEVDLSGREITSFHVSEMKDAPREALRLARSVGVLGSAMQWIAAAERRLAEVQAAVGYSRRSDPQVLPTVLIVQAGYPPRTGDRLAGSLVEAAGGRPIFGDGEPTNVAGPDVTLVLGAYAAIELTHGGGRVVRAADAASFLEAGPWIYRSAERLAALLYPDRLPDVDPEVETVSP